MKEKIKANIKGHLKVFLITDQGREKIVDRPNAITGDAGEITISCLGDETKRLGSIRAKKAGVNLADATITTFNYPSGGLPTIQAVATFSKTSFNDTLDELNLINLQGVVFSVVDSLNVTKDSTAQLEVIWELAFQTFN